MIYSENKMIEHIKVTIAVPVYNVESYIKRCLDSLLIQTLKEIEIILVDDGSTDDSGQICDTYSEKDNRIKVCIRRMVGLLLLDKRHWKTLMESILFAVILMIGWSRPCMRKCTPRRKKQMPTW